MASQSVLAPAQPVPGEPVRDKIATAAEAVRLVRDGVAVVVGGFLGSCFPEELVLALQRRFADGGAPRDLTVVFTVAAGDLQGRGLHCLARPGLVRPAIGGHWAGAPAFPSSRSQVRSRLTTRPSRQVSRWTRERDETASMSAVTKSDGRSAFTVTRMPRFS